MAAIRIVLDCRAYIKRSTARTPRLTGSPILANSTQYYERWRTWKWSEGQLILHLCSSWPFHLYYHEDLPLDTTTTSAPMHPDPYCKYTSRTAPQSPWGPLYLTYQYREQPQASHWVTADLRLRYRVLVPDLPLISPQFSLQCLEHKAFARKHYSRAVHLILSHRQFGVEFGF